MNRGLAGTMLACALVWSDSFPLPVAERQYGPGVRQEVKVEVCDGYREKQVWVWTRIVREVQTQGAVETQQLYGWDRIVNQAVGEYNPPPAPPPCDDERCSGGQ